MVLNPRFEITPIIIKGKACGSDSDAVACFEISGLEFSVTAEFHHNPQEWLQSTSVFEVNGIESIVVGEMGTQQQFCETSNFEHPLTVKFISVDGDNENTIFTISEGQLDASGNCLLTISVIASKSYFTITQATKQEGDDWDKSEGDFSTPIDVVMVTDKNDTARCRLVKLTEPIYINILPRND